MDSAYHNDMTTSSSLFSKMHFAYPPFAIHIVNGSNMVGPSQSSISTSNICISEVLHVPKVSYNLVSLGQLAQLSYHVIFYYYVVLCRSTDRTGTCNRSQSGVYVSNEHFSSYLSSSQSTS
ncbi:hypothetical protein CIPAW_07G000700 [Carya illinoinensis]|uniref:Retrovirus-related Pol polyprotein from transposon TNT 1-94-like beta-barrel domain-containing protein n=1 Tax=Carya illinoinensis TaxID=32201 RepID=A0A8T1PWX6_CARIL|nr:hypothetical protein CIPAW_07G000700 [Carya illinoinensis]